MALAPIGNGDSGVATREKINEIIDAFGVIDAGTLADIQAAEAAATDAVADAVAAAASLGVSGAWYGGTAGGTANALTVTATGAPGYTDGLRVRFYAGASDNTGAATLAVNGGVAASIRNAASGNLVAGDLKAGYLYEATYKTGGNNWRIVQFPQDRSKLFSIYALATAVGGTANAITVTGDVPISNGLMVYFKPTLNNTATSVTLSYNGATATSLRKHDGALLAVGDVVANRGVLVRYDATGGNPWVIIADGVTTAEVEAAVARIAALETVTSDERFAADLSKVTPFIAATPYGGFTWSAGTRTDASKRIVVTGVGSSVGAGAGSSVEATYAPNAQLVAALTAEFADYGLYSFVNDNQSVGGQAFSQFGAQFAASAEGTKHFVLMIPGMNDFTPGQMNCGQGFVAQPTLLEALIASARAANAIPLVCTSPHPHPTRTPTLAIPTDNPMSWPYSTLNVTGSIIATAGGTQTLYSTLFSNSTYGGDILKAGDTLKLFSGANAGYHVISSISVDRNTITIAGTLTTTETVSMNVRHVLQDTELVMWPALSDSWPVRDWTGSGIETQGNLRFWIGNNMIRDVCRKNGVACLDAEQAFFKQLETYGSYASVGVAGYNALYDNPNYNHPNDLGYTSSYGAVIGEFVAGLSKITLDRMILA